jgi:ubiquinol-cytochrome c reductase core subunit 2
VKAGTRYETKPGVAHALKNFAFKNTAQKSALRIARESELYGGVLSTTLGREHLAITAEFLKGDENFFVPLLSSLLTSTKFTTHEFHESVLPQVVSESLEASGVPSTQALEVAHALAFRNGLGSPLFTSSAEALTSEDIKAFAAEAFAKGNVAVFGTGIEQSVLSKLVSEHLASAPSSSTTKSTPTKYFGGESRVASAHGPQTIFIGFGSTSPSSDLSVLASYLSPTPSVKWTAGSSPINGEVLPKGTSVETVLLPYSDATLFGLLVQGDSAASAKEAGKLAVKALKDASNLGGDELKRAIAKAKFAEASKVEGRDGLVGAVANNLLNNQQHSLDNIFASLDKVSSSTFSKAVSTLTGAKPTYVVVGDVQALPYADEVGL